MNLWENVSAQTLLEWFVATEATVGGYLNAPLTWGAFYHERVQEPNTKVAAGSFPDMRSGFQLEHSSEAV